MGKNEIVLDCLSDYDDEVIYKFVTEELFEEMVDDFRIDGMRTCFIYEEFHPNYDYDLRNHSNKFLDRIIKREWNDEFDSFHLCDRIELNEKIYTREEFSKIIHVIQESSKTLEIRTFCILEVLFSLESRIATVRGFIDSPGKNLSHKRNFNLEFIIDDLGYWVIRKARISGM